MDYTLSPERLVEAIRMRMSQQSAVMEVLWYRVQSHREDFRQGIERHRAELRLVPLVVRDDGFASPNAILSDLCRLIDQNKPAFDSDWFRNHPRGTPMTIVLLSRTELHLAQVASPAVLPEWFPELGGQLIEVVISDITHTVSGPLNSAESQFEDICARIWEFDSILVRRLICVSDRNHNAGNALFESIRDKDAPNEKYREFLCSAELYLKAIATPEAFRPSAREGRSLTGRLMRLISRTSPDELSSRAKALASALAVPDSPQGGRESIMAVLARPTSPDDGARRLGRNILVTLYAAAQFTTAAAHSDAYPRFPLGLLRHISLDIRENLADISSMIVSLP